MQDIKITLIALITMCSSILLAQQTPAAKQTKDFAVVGGTAHIGNGDIIENCLMIIRDGKITTIANGKLAKFDLSGMDIIDASGKHIYPGFIIPNTTLGLVEIGAVRATNDHDEVGTFNPHIRSLIAYNAESKIVESMRPNGVLLGQITPRGGRISGTSSIVQFDAWNWEDAAIKADDGIHMNWPRIFSRDPDSRDLIMNKKYAEEIRDIQNLLNQSNAYMNGAKTTRNLKYESIHGLFNGSKKLYINVDDVKGITDAITFCKDNQIKSMVIVGGRDAHKVADLLKKHAIPVLLQRVHSRPSNEDNDYDLPFKMAKLLVDKGVLVALEASGQMERMNSRNLPFYAGTTVAYGLTKEQALELITLNTAKILGIDANYGSLSAKKSATFFISEGDALDMRTNIISHAFIDGRALSLETHQTKLWKRYSEKHQAQE